MKINAMAQPTTKASKRSISPRPPAVGEEVKKFYDTPHNFSEQCKNWNMEYQIKTPCAEYVDRSVNPSFSENVIESEDCVENFPNPSPPPPNKWAQSLLSLLEDIQGVSLFQQFLKQEGQDTRCLSFWFACRGVKRHDPNDRDGLVKLINVVFEKKVKRISAISADTKDEIRQKLLSNTDVDDTIFDVAQRDVEMHMMKTTYPNFLSSDLYIQHLRDWQNNDFSPPEKECTVSPEPVDLLPTVHEDSELQVVNNKIPLTKINLLQRNKISVVSKLKPEGPAGYLRSPYSNYSSYHTKYGSFLPASAQDSELQSLSSDAQTDDTMSLTDSGVDNPSYNRNKQKRCQKPSKHSAIMNDVKLNHGTFIPRTERLPESMQPLSPQEFYSILVRKLNKVLDEQKMKDKISERLKILEGTECSKQEVVSRSSAKPNAAPVFESGFLCEPSEENVQDILDQHISRVFEDSGQPTPGSECLSPPIARPTSEGLESSRVPPQGISCEPPQDVSLGASRKQGLSHFHAPNSIKHKRDHDTHSTDSAMFDYVSDDNMSANYRSQYSLMANSEPVDYSRRSREHSKRNVSKKFSAVTDSSSCVDSGISLACESVPGYSKVTYWLETKRVSDQERDHLLWRNSSTSPVFSRSSASRKAVVYNSSRSGSQEIGCSQWSAISTQIIAQDSMSSWPPPDTTSNLLEARRRLEDETRAKLKKCASGGRTSHDAPRMKFSKGGYDSYDDGVCHRKLSRKLFPTALETPVSSTSNDLTVVGYSYGRHSVPYLSKMPGKNITLQRFKSLLSKKGNFRYFFKTASDDFGTGVVFEEVTDDYKVLPMWEGKVFCVIESMDDNPTM